MPTLKKSRPVFCDGAALAGNGADNGVRTRDPHLGKVVLYQLSHVRIAWIYYSNLLTFARFHLEDHGERVSCIHGATLKMVGGTRFELVTPTVSR